MRFLALRALLSVGWIGREARYEPRSWSAQGRHRNIIRADRGAVRIKCA
jgi:hypothetical protein